MATTYTFNYEIKEPIASRVAGAALTLELNRIAYNGGRPKLDLRRWQRLEGEEPKMLKGLTLTTEDAAWLVGALQEYMERETA